MKELTPKQQEFLELYNLGLPLADIARQMGIATNTAGSYVTALGLGGTRRAQNGDAKDARNHHGGLQKQDRTKTEGSAVYLRPGAQRNYEVRGRATCEMGTCPREARCRARVDMHMPVECELQ